MKIGIISDTHDNVPMIRKAVEYFNGEAMDLVIHAGDYVAPFSFKPLLDLNCELLGVWGNNDGDKLALTEVSQGKIAGVSIVRKYEGKIILVGHYFETLDALVASQKYSLIVYGHTHKPEIRKVGNSLIVNPGECGGWLYGSHTIAVADLDTLEAQLVSLSLGR